MKRPQNRLVAVGLLLFAFVTFHFTPNCQAVTYTGTTTSRGTGYSQAITSGGSTAWTNLADLVDADDTDAATVPYHAGNSHTVTVNGYLSSANYPSCCTVVSSISATMIATGTGCDGGSSQVLQSLVLSSGSKSSSSKNDPYNLCRTAPNTYTFSGAPAAYWGMTNWNHNDYATSNFGASTYFSMTSKSGGTSLSYISLAVDWSVTTTVTAVTPNPFIGKGGAITITGTGFANLPGGSVKCRLSTAPTGGTVMKEVSGIVNSATSISCNTGTMPNWGTYYVSISLDGTTFTTESVSIRFDCNGAETCNNHGTCDNTGKCTCSAGWGGSTCSQIDCSHLNFCSNHGSCVAGGSGAGICSCVSGWTGNNCNTPDCSSLNNCNGHGSCTDANKCTCTGGWSGNSCDTASCTDKDNCNQANGGGTCTAPSVCTCNSGFTGPNCYRPASACTPTCPTNADCVDTNECRCRPPWQGTNCDVQFTCAAGCGNGVCIAQDQCQCNPGYKGPTCAQFDCPDYNQCNSHGTCTGPNTCTCSSGWLGASCNIPDCIDSGNNCNRYQGGGNCIAPHTCSCNPGWATELTNCTEFVCDQVVCGVNSTCTGPNQCSCKDGWIPPTCSGRYNCSTLENCNSLGGGGFCAGDQVCTCYPGWIEPNCLVANCSEVNNCTGPENGLCVGPNQCSCLGSWTGADCAAEQVVGQPSDAGVPVGMVAGIAGGAGGALILLGAVGVIVYFKKIRPRSYRFKEPLFLQALFGKYTTLQYAAKQSDIAKLRPLEDLLLAPGLVLASGIATTTQATEKERVARSLVYYFSSHKMAYALLLKLINIEVENAEGEGTLFRANSMAIGMFQVYSKIIGLRYIWDTLGGFITELNALSEEAAKSKQRSASMTGGSSVGNRSLVSDSLEMEIDPNKLESGANAINKYKLLLTTQKLFQVIVESVDVVPSELRGILSHVAEKVVARFPNAKFKAVGAFMFLRFIVPCITSPHIYGLLPMPPNEQTQRNLVLLAKVLQNLANEAQFGAKEPHMQRLNDFIVENQESMHQFFDAISTKPNNIEEPFDIPSEVTQNGLLDLHGYLFEYLARVSEGLNQVGEVDTAKSVQEVIAQLGEPIQVKKI